jgi:hypothetical protein
MKSASRIMAALRAMGMYMPERGRVTSTVKGAVLALARTVRVLLSKRVVLHWALLSSP